jgi:hypothetical protein
MRKSLFTDLSLLISTANIPPKEIPRIIGFSHVIAVFIRFAYDSSVSFSNGSSQSIKTGSKLENYNCLKTRSSAPSPLNM